MSRRTSNADGTITILSMSYWGNGDANEEFKMQYEAVEQHNREALVICGMLSLMKNVPNVLESSR